MKRVSFLGYGRFGAALGEKLEEAGHEVGAFDPRAVVPSHARRASLEDLVPSADVVIVAVPLGAMRGAFESLRPLLSPHQTVIDVGSVKTGPARDMAAVFGAAQPWVATHPLFGPVSLARGERPLRAIVCPNDLHPGAVAAVTGLFEQIGCDVVRMTPDEHDRAMAFTHALTFFVAKGLLDAGAPPFAPFAPPSYHAISHTIELVRSDAGHLFEALERENPHAAGARQKLIDALLSVHEDLAGPAARGPLAEPSPKLSIPDLGDRSPELREARELIDELDQELVTLIARRAELARRAGRAKAKIGHAVRDPDREARLLEARRAWAAEAGLDPGGVEGIFHAILELSRRLQEQSG